MGSPSAKNLKIRIATVTLTETMDPYWPEPANALYLHRIAISRNHACQNLGQHMIQWCEHEAARRGHTY